MMPTAPKYWFPAKRYGWGIPATWQGWLTLLIFFGLVIAGVFIFPPAHARAAFFLYVAALSAGLVGICWLTGEPPHWRWGAEKPPHRREIAGALRMPPPSVAVKSSIFCGDRRGRDGRRPIEFVDEAERRRLFFGTEMNGCRRRGQFIQVARIIGRVAIIGASEPAGREHGLETAAEEPAVGRESGR